MIIFDVNVAKRVILLFVYLNILYSTHNEISTDADIHSYSTTFIPLGVAGLIAKPDLVIIIKLTRVLT